MSYVAHWKKTDYVPAGVKIQIAPDAVEVQGPKGKMNVNLPRGITLEQKGAELHAIRESTTKPRCMAWRARW